MLRFHIYTHWDGAGESGFEVEQWWNYPLTNKRLLIFPAGLLPSLVPSQHNSVMSLYPHVLQGLMLHGNSCFDNGSKLNSFEVSYSI